jgi:tetratricopeptide (TPR) repeat protein
VIVTLAGVWLLAAPFAAPTVALAAGARAVQVFEPTSGDVIVLRLDPRSTPIAAPSLAIEPNSRDALLGLADRLQYQHRFAEAEQRLSQWLSRSPEDADARLKRAQVRLASGNARGALVDCLRAEPQLDALAASACRAQVQAALGDLPGARRLIETALARAAGSTAIESYAAGIAGELAARDRAYAPAEIFFKRSLASAGDAHYPRIAYAEFLLSQKRAADTLALLRDVPDSSAVIRLRRLALEQS